MWVVCSCCQATHPEEEVELLSLQNMTALIAQERGSSLCAVERTLIWYLLKEFLREKRATESFAATICRLWVSCYRQLSVGLQQKEGKRSPFCVT